MDYNMGKYGTSLTNEIIAESLSKDIIEQIELNQSQIINLDFSTIKLLTTYSVKSIFRPISEKYGIENIFSHIQLINVNKDLQVIIKQGLNSIVE